MKKRTFVISEAGSNHNQNFHKAKQLIDIAKMAGSDAVKFQLYSSKTLYSRYTPDFSCYKNIPDLISKIEFPRSWSKDIKKYCDDNDIEFMSTPFDKKDIDELYDIGVKRLKISSFEATDPRIVKYAGETNLPLIISLGAGFRGSEVSLKEIISWIFDKGCSPHVSFLYCNSSYPTPVSDIRFETIRDYQNQLYEIEGRRYFFQHSVGFSDHTLSTIIPSLSLFYDASIIEKHFTINRKDNGPDHHFSLQPNELEKMIKNIRETEKIINQDNIINNLSMSETNNDMLKATRSIVAKRDIKKGEILTEENITTKRPFLENSLPAYSFYKVLNKKKVSKDIKIDEIIKNDWIF